MIVLNTPHNPLGKMFSKEELEEIGRVAIEQDLLIISDEVVPPRPNYPFKLSLTLMESSMID